VREGYFLPKGPRPEKKRPLEALVRDLPSGGATFLEILLELLGHDGTRGDDTVDGAERVAFVDQGEGCFTASNTGGIIRTRAVEVKGFVVALIVLSRDVNIDGGVRALFLGGATVGEGAGLESVADKGEFGAEEDDEHGEQGHDEPSEEGG